MKLLAICAIAVSALSIPKTNTELTKSLSSADSSFVYIYRVGQFGGALSNFSVFVDGKKLCKISNNKYFKIALSPGNHVINAKVGGMSVFKKETEVELDVKKGEDYYVACNMKQSVTRVRLEMTEVTKNSGKKQMEGMTEDKCQEKLDSED
jgi:hypothetical protein